MDAGVVELQHLAELLAGAGVQLLAPPPVRDVRVRGSHLHDGELPSTGGHLILAIGWRPTDASTADLCAQAAASGQAGVVLKSYGQDLARVAEQAAHVGIAVFTVPDELAWADLHSLVVAALATGTALESSDLGEDLFALADSIAAVFGSSVAIEDLAQNVVSYSSLPGQLIDDVRIAGILGRRVPRSAASAAQYQQVYAASGVVRFPYQDGEQPRAAIAVRAGALPLGSIWALEAGGVELGDDLDPERIRALERGAVLAARHLMRDHDAGAPQARQRRAVFEALLAGQSVSRGEVAQLADSDVLTLSAIAPMTAGRRTVEIARLVARQYRALRPQSVVSAGHDGVYVLHSGEDGGASRRVAREVLSTVESSVGVGLCAAVSAVFSSPTDLPAARNEVDDIVRCLRAEGSASRVADTADVRAQLLLFACAERLAADSRLRHPGVQAMRESDGAYAATVLSWLENGGSIPAAARELHVHENTVRYRLGRIPSLFGIPLDDPDARLALWLQMRMSTAGTTGSGASRS